MIHGTPKFTGLAIAEVSVNLLGPTISLKAKAAFVNQGNGATHGWTNGEGGIWSPLTVAKMREAIALMEADMAKQHFSGTSSDPVTDAEAPAGLSGGLGEHVSGEGEQV